KPEHREMLQMMYDEATRIGRITSSLLAFARAGGKQRGLVDLNDIARRTFALRSYYLSTLNITVALHLDPSEPKIWADASELQQMLLNLLINADQAPLTVARGRPILRVAAAGPARGSPGPRCHHAALPRRHRPACRARGGRRSGVARGAAALPAAP